MRKDTYPAVPLMIAAGMSYAWARHVDSREKEMSSSEWWDESTPFSLLFVALVFLTFLAAIKNSEDPVHNV